MTEKAKPPVAYEDRLCLFIDILGFKNHVEESVKPADKDAKTGHRPFTVARLHRALSVIDRAMAHELDGIGDSFKTTKRVTQFSDSVVASYRVDEKSALFDMLYDIYLLQVELISHGIFIRGAITIGKLHHDDKLVFGPALVEAAELEKLAMYPRVILSQEVIDQGKSKHAPHHSSKDEEKSIMSLLKQDLDGMFFIDYFGVSAGEFDDEWDGLFQHLIELRGLIKRLSNLTRTPSIKLKHSWLRQKFNEIARPLEQSRYRQLNGGSVPEDLEDHIRSLAPFK